jgi:hypothetical protein
MDAVSSSAPAETTPQETSAHIDPVPNVPPEQEQQVNNPDQLLQHRSDDDPPTAGVSQSKALEGKRTKAAPGQQDFQPTPATTIEELLKNAYFVADGIDEPVVDSVGPHVINLHYPADGSLATIKVEARSGAWGGIGHKSSPEHDADRNEHYNKMKDAAAAPSVPPEEAAAQESHDDAHAREDSKPQDPREDVSPAWGPANPPEAYEQPVQPEQEPYTEQTYPYER